MNGDIIVLLGAVFNEAESNPPPSLEHFSSWDARCLSSSSPARHAAAIAAGNAACVTCCIVLECLLDADPPDICWILFCCC